MQTLSTGADPAAVGPYLVELLGDDAWAACDVSLIEGGKSNLTYAVRSTAGELVVLRRPPLGHTLPTAHDVGREHRVLSALAGSPVPVPAALHLCTDTAVIGAPFLVMEHVAGPVARTELPPAYGVGERAVLADALVDTLAAIHSVDPSAAGLTGFGRPDGFLARQVARWSRQWAATPGEDVPELGSLGETLAARLPHSPSGRLVHGDYRLDNTILTADTPGLAAVLDWELSTLGDPLADLGLLLVYWAQADDDDLRRGAARGSTLTRLPGFPTRRAIAARYADVSGRDLSSLPWYVAFGCFKLAVVVGGVAARHQAGAMVGDGFAGIASALRPLVRLGLRTLRSDSID